MNSYEIRIVRKDDNAQLVVSANLLGDHAAIRRARMLAGSGDLVEVWRGMTCVYSTMPESVH
jgi:DNA-binding transcriptional regulator/RsmH inhibitor MraZ